MSDNIKVVVKVRPLIPREIEDKLGYQWRVNNNTLYQIDQNGRDCGPCYTFDKVYDKDTGTNDVYNDIAKPIVEAAIAGFNGTIFAYGQTSSGKTYTMTGTKDAPGIIPLAVLNLFDIIQNIPNRDFLVRVSYVEIYNDTLIDLLDLKKNIKICETFEGVKVDATEKLTTSPEEVLDIMREGKANRQTGATNMNEESSRSHSIFQITIESREHIEGEEEVGSVNVSQLNLVDLAGSERSGQTGASGKRFREGTHINKSLSVLALVIKQLSEGPNKHANYRDSKLTRMLQNSLGGNAKTSIICAVTPAAVEETISTLQFANRAKAIKNSPAVNVVATNATMIQTLTKQLASLKTQLETKKNVEQDNHNLQKQIGALQRLILNGFAQRSTTDIIGARRKLIPPRRVTISTLHPIQEDTVPAIPKFCTPSLKYNPMSIASTSDFVPIQNAASLPSVTEELRLVTPPPTGKKVNVSGEIIELDSDDDNSTDVQTCSPYHKCYQSKTPPCVLRNNAKQAEKNLQDIVELTEREKIYTPNIVELIEKLESKSTTIATLEDEVSRLNKLSYEKDLEMEKLKTNVNKLEDEIKNINTAKADLEEACKDYSTKLTDWEFSYETLKKKAKSREDELLSLLREHEAKKIGKLAPKPIERDFTNFMDLSRDISLVSSDNENSIIHVEEKQVLEVPAFKSNEEREMSLKDQTILELKADLESHKLKIESLEAINKEFQEMISNYQEKLTLIENENSLHKSTIDNLNNTIENQKTVIQNINADVESYNSVIQELQIKLAKREKGAQNLSDLELEAIMNEEMFIASNENIKNIIHSLKFALNYKNEEIQKLKSALDKGNDLDIIAMQKELDSNKKVISSLIEEVECLKTQSNESVVVVDKLLEEKKNLLHLEQQLRTELTAIKKDKELLNETIEQQKHEITDLKEYKENTNNSLEEKECAILSIKSIHNDEIKMMSQKLTMLEQTIQEKENIIVSLRKTENQTQENLDRVQSNIRSLSKVMVLFTGNIMEVPDKMNDLVSMMTMLGDNLTSLESLASEVVEEKKQVVATLAKREIEIEYLHSQICHLSDSIDSFYNEYESLVNINNKIRIYNKDEKELENNTLSPSENLKHKMNNLMDTIKSTQTYLKQTLQEKENEIKELNSKYKSKQTELESEAIKINKYEEKIEDLINKRDKLLQNILEKSTDLTSECNIENSVSCQFNSNPENLYENILLTLDKIGNHISIINSKRDTDHNNIETILSDAKTEIKQLTEENIKLIHDISYLESNNNALNNEIKKIQDDSKILTKDLQESNNLLNELQNNLASKSDELQNIETKASEWRDKFKSLETVMKKQIDILEFENIELKDEHHSNNVESKESLMKPNFFNDVSSPPSLLKICCESIIDAISSTEDDKTTSPESSVAGDAKNIPSALKHCQCKELETDLNILKTDNNYLKTKIEELENEKANLLQEQEEVQKEVQLLIENTHELQKKLLNHRTNLSTLTATTYAENKSLSSKVKFLQHHHNRFHVLCQRDIPDFKKQLQELLILLKSENVGKLNESLKRYSLPNALESVPLYLPFRNESTIDGDLLMLDTNITLTTCDNTLISHDQTYFDVTQVCMYNEVACQTNLSEISKSNSSYSQIETQSLDDTKMLETLESLKIENGKLREVVDEYARNKKLKSLKDTQSSPIKISINSKDNLHINNNEEQESCTNCIHKEELKIQEETHKKEIDTMTRKLTDIESEKLVIEVKYQNLSLEVPSTEVLVRKLGTLEKDKIMKQNEIDELKICLKKKRDELNTLQEENDLLSNQIMESISEVDDLKKDHDTLKEINVKLTNKFSELENEIKRLKSKNSSEKQTPCTECTVKDEIINTLRSNIANSHQKLDRSYSDSDSSSRYNKICTLQNELHAGKKDCIELKEQVTTIKNHLDRTDLSMDHDMDLDDTMGDTHMCSFSQDFDNVKSHDNKYGMPGIPEERPINDHVVDKIACINYYIEKTAADKDILNNDIKILDVMKMLYYYIEKKHANEIENLYNKLRDFEDSKAEIEMQLSKASSQQNKLSKELKEKDDSLKTLANVVSQIRSNIDAIKSSDFNDMVPNFSAKFLMKIDKEFGFSSTKVFEYLMQQILDKHKIEIEKVTSENKHAYNAIQIKCREVEFLNERLSDLSLVLGEKEVEFEVLNKEKNKIQEISTAVTIDIIQKERNLLDKLVEYHKKFLDAKILNEDIDMTLPTRKIINLMFENILSSCNKASNIEMLEKEKESIVLELDKAKMILDAKDNELQVVKGEFEKMKQVNIDLNSALSEIEYKLEEETSTREELNKTYESKIEEKDMKVKELTKEILSLKADVLSKDTLITSLESKVSTFNSNMENNMRVTELLKLSESLQTEIDTLKSVNEVIVKEKLIYESELESTNAIIKQNKIDFEKLTSDILVLKETIKANSTVTESLRLESKRLLEENVLLQSQLHEKVKECSRIEDNIKKHEKTAEIQSGIIIRLKKQKQEDEQLCVEKDNQIEELTDICRILETQREELSNELQATKEQVEEFAKCKLLLESRISELESETNAKPRLSIDAAADSSRRRRQSIHDSKRMFSDDIEEHMKVEAVFTSHAKPDDLFMDVDESGSNRSTPHRLSRGRDSLLSKYDQNSREDEASAARRRRRSAHDRRRSVADLSGDSSQNNSLESGVTQLRKQLSSCQQELEELKERCRELDEECETCAEYLKERDEQCVRLKREKLALENMVADLKEKLKSSNTNHSTVPDTKISLVSVAVNTDEDWTNLHSVVVDRMSYDAEVEKNKKFMKTIEELRFKKQELKKTMARMQKALEKNTVKDSKELESARAELSSCKRELEELRQKYSELDEECDTCARYLRERDDQCRQLKEGKAALEAKLEEYHNSSNITQSVRKKRQSLHDKNRSSPSTLTDASTETNDDFLSYQVEKDDNSLRSLDDKHTKEIKRLKTALEMLSQQKVSLEHQLMTAAATPLYVATGSAIIQNQQLTDVMKENQKLKKINAKLVTICKKRGKSLADSNRENEQPVNN